MASDKYSLIRYMSNKGMLFESCVHYCINNLVKIDWSIPINSNEVVYTITVNDNKNGMPVIKQLYLFS